MRRIVLVLASCLIASSAAHAWEPNTNAGLTEQAALSSPLHAHLRDHLGIERGLFASLIIPPQDATSLFEVFDTLNPTHGHVPDSRGQLLALGWLAAGSVVADIPPSHAVHHFFDPLTGKGLSDDTVRGLSDSVRHAIVTRLNQESVARAGMPAPDWITHADNPMNLAGFLAQYRKAVSARTPGERERHVAGALLAAGAMLHVLQDMGSPSHVRNDLAAHLDVVGKNERDVGSRFERIAALAYGRLGVPAPRGEVKATSLRALFTAADGSGLADRTSQRWFSSYTLPRPIRIRPGIGARTLGPMLEQSVVRPHPVPLPRLDLEAARSQEGARLTYDSGVCAANYQLRDNVLSWYLGAECVVEQVAIILPEVGAYSRAMLGILFRGAIELKLAGKQLNATAVGVEFGAGTVEWYWDDASGVRTKYGQPLQIQKAAASALIANVPTPPKQARAVAALFTGVDQAGEPLVAPGYLSLVKARRAKPKN